MDFPLCGRSVPPVLMLFKGHLHVDVEVALETREHELWVCVASDWPHDG